MEEQPKPILIKPNFKDENVIQFMRDMAALAKKAGVKSCFIMTIDGNNHVSWDHVIDNEHHAALAIIAVEDARSELKSILFQEPVDE